MADEKIYAEIPEDDTRPGSVRRGSSGRSRTVVMPDGQIINNVPGDITDDQVKNEYYRQQNDKLAPQAGYDVQAARDIGFKDEQQTNQYLQGHPRYDVEQQTQKDVSAMPWWQKQLQGVKAAVGETLTGIQQIPNEIGPAQPTPVREALRQQAATAEATGRGVREAGGGPGYYATEVAKTLALMASGRIAGPAGLRVMTGGGSLMERQAGAGLQGFISGLMQPVSGDDESKQNAILRNLAFSVGGQAAVDAFRAAPFAFKQQVATGLNLLNASPNQLAPEAERTVLGNIARDKFGMELPAAEATGNPILRGIQSLGRALPFGNVNENRMIAKNAKQADRAALASMGSRGDALNPTTIGDAGSDIGGRLDMIAGRGPVKLGSDYKQEVQSALDSYSKLNTGDQATIDLLTKWVDPSKLKGAKPVFKGNQTQGAFMSADQLLKERSNLSREAAAADRAGNYQLADAKGALVDAIDNAIEKSLPANQQGMYAEAREQYRNYLIVRRAYDEKAGDIVPGKLSSAIRSKYGDAANSIPSGQNDLIDLSRVMNMFGIKEARPGQMSGFIKGSTGAGTALVGAGAVGGGPATMGAGAALGLTVPPVLTNLGTSSRLGRYLTNPMSEDQARALAVLIRSQAGGLGQMTPLNAPPNQ